MKKKKHTKLWIIIGILVVLIIIVATCGDDKTSETEDGEDPSRQVSDIATETPESETKVTYRSVKEAIENGDFSLVSPDFKESMDAYEAFHDEYIAFMEKYNDDSRSSQDKIDDYYEYMDKYYDYMDQIGAIDPDSLSEADLIYYQIVTMRVSKKLMEYSQKVN